MKTRYYLPFCGVKEDEKGDKEDADKKEEVLRWYESAKAALIEAGIDLKNPADLLRIRTMYLEKDGVYRGVDYDKKAS